MVLDYSVSMPADEQGPAWTAKRAGTMSRGWQLWKVRSNVSGAEKRLVEAGLLDAIDEAEHRAVHLRPRRPGAS